MQGGIKLKYVNITNIFIITLVVMIILLLLLFFITKITSNAKNIGINYAHEYADSAEYVINKYSTILESGASNLSYFMTKKYSNQDIEEWMQNYIAYIENTLGSTCIDVFGVIDGKLLSGQKRLDSVTINTSEMKFYTEAIKNNGKVHYSDIYNDIVNNEKVFTLSVALNNSDNVLAIDIFPKQLGNRWLLDKKLPEDASYFLIDSKGEIIFQSTSINQSTENFELAMKKTIGKIYSGNHTYNSAYSYIIDLEGNKRSLFYSFTSNNMIVVLTIPQNVLYKEAINIVVQDIVSFTLKYIELLLLIIFIIAIIIFQIVQLNKTIKYQHQAIQAIGNSYVAIFRVNIKTKKYVSIKQSEIMYNSISLRGDYETLINSFYTLMDTETKKEFVHSFSIDNIRKIAKKVINEFGGDFKYTVNDKEVWMNVSILFSNFLNNDETLLCLKNVDTERQKQLENMELLSNTIDNMQDNIKFNKQLYSSVSHDMRTPINSIFGLTKLLKLNFNNQEKIIEYSDKIQVSANLLKALVDDIVEQMNIESSKQEQNIVEFNLQKDIDTILDVFKIQAETENKTFNVYYNIKVEQVLGDYNKLCHIINNLLSNAFKYTNEKDTIEFSINQLNTGAEPLYQIIVKDSGVGMSRSFLERIFEPFAREKIFNDKKIQGTGLGMAIVLDRVKTMSGEIKIDSAIGEGTIITITLPFSKPTYDNIEHVKENNYNEKAFENITVLVVDDDKINLEILKELLSIKKINVLYAQNGAEAVEIFKNSQEYSIDIILMDIQMPIMNGYEATINIRNLKRQDSTLPIIALTGNTFAEDIQATIKAGMDTHLTKPINYNILFNTIYQFITLKSK